MIKMPRAALLSALTAVVKALPRRNSIPVLNNLLLEIQNKALRLSATNLDQQISILVELENDAEPVSDTVPGLIFYDIIRRLPEDATVNLSFLNNTMNITSGKSKFNLQTLPAENFPPIANTIENTCQFTILENALERIYNQVCFAIAPDESRTYLNGVYLHIDKTEHKQLNAVATDGHRLSLINIELPSEVDITEGVIVPKQFWQMAKGLFKANSSIDVNFDSNKIIMKQENITIISKLVDGVYPDYQRVIPTNNEYQYTVDSAALQSAIDRVDTINVLRGQSTLFTFDEKKLALQVKTPEGGSAQDEISLETGSTSETFEIAFNGRYFNEALNACTTDKVTICLATKETPAIIKMPDIGNAIFVVMPMRF